MKSKYFIYHIPGVKIGVSNNPDKRTFAQGFTEYEILEEHTNIKVVSQRERELQIQYGYKVDNILYWKTIQFQKKGASPKARKKAVANTDYKARKIDWVKKVANMDYKAKSANTDYKARTENFDYKAKGEKCKKQINQYDVNNNLINTYKGLEAVKIALGKSYDCTRAISRCCRGEQKIAFNYIWKYAG